MLLRKDDPWNQTLKIPDVRNWRVVDTNGRPVGFVESVVIDPKNNRWEAILTGANERFGADELEVDEQIIRVQRSLERRAPQASASATDEVHFEDAFRDHFKQSYDDGDVYYEDVREAYVFGRTMALDADFAGRSYPRAEEDLKAHWVSRKHLPSYDRAADAVRFAYELTHSTDRYEMAGMEREGKQIFDPHKQTAERSEAVGAYMATGSPPPKVGSEEGRSAP